MVDPVFSPHRGHHVASADAAPLVLDASQLAVLELAPGTHAAVHGAPGTGKTTTLVELLAHRVDQLGWAPEDVVAITPDRRSATALRDRISLRLDTPTRGALARTLGSLAFGLVQVHAVAEARPVPRLLTGAEQDAIIADLLAGEIQDGTDIWPPTLDPDVRVLRGFRTELRELMMRLVETGTRPAQLAALGAENQRPEWIAAAAFIERYELVLDSYTQRSLDSAEIIAEATALIREGAVTPPRLIVLDDVQEQGPGAYRFLRAAVRAGSTVIAFGDPDVASATFRGSNPGAISRLGDLLGTTVPSLFLDTVHRHGQPLRDVIAELTGRIGAAGAIEHRRAQSAAAGAAEPAADVPPVVRIDAATSAAEHRAIARVLREHHLFRGVPWSKMAIIVRSSASIPALARSLALSDVPTSTTSGTASLRDRFAARSLAQIVAVGLDIVPATIDLVTDLLTGPFGGLDGIGLRRLRRALRHEEILAGGNRHSDDLLLEAMAAPDRFVTLDTAVARRAARLATSIAEVRAQRREGASAEELLWTVWSRSGLAEVWARDARGTGLAAEEANTHLDAVLALFTSAKRAVERDPDAAAEVFLEAVLGAELGEDSLAPQSRHDTVWIGTPNAVVGSEYDVVVVARVQAGAWPNPTLRGGLVHPQLFSQVRAGLPVADIDARAEILSDELRMFALAASRARTQVVLSATDSDDEQASAFLRFPAIAAAPVRTGVGEWPLNLRGMVGALRRTLVEATVGASSDALGEIGRGEARVRAEQAAAALARLAQDDIGGASPDDWFGLRTPSTSAPVVDLADPEATVSVSPSRVEAYEKSPLNWFIDDVAATPSGIAAGVGTIVHAAMEEVGKLELHRAAALREQIAELEAQGADDAAIAAARAAAPPNLGHDDITVAKLWGYVNQRWSELRFDAPWLGERERIAADEMLRGVSAYLATGIAKGKTLAAAEGSFTVQVGQIRVTGKIDRVERIDADHVVIVDLKTGKRAPTRTELPHHAQLAAYQLAAAEGAILDADRVPLADAASGGAALLYVRTPTKDPYREHEQEPQNAAAREAFIERVTEVGTGMAAAEFEGIFGTGSLGDPLSNFSYRIHLVAEVSE